MGRVVSALPEMAFSWGGGIGDLVITFENGKRFFIEVKPAYKAWLTVENGLRELKKDLVGRHENCCSRGGHL
jgi:hypothetical protein